MNQLNLSYGKISEVWGLCISKEKLTPNLAQKIGSYLTDNNLNNLCAAVPYKYAKQILKSTTLKECIDIQEMEQDTDTALLRAKESLQDIDR